MADRILHTSKWSFFERRLLKVPLFTSKDVRSQKPSFAISLLLIIWGYGAYAFFTINTSLLASVELSYASEVFLSTPAFAV